MVMDIDCYVQNYNSCRRSIIPQNKTPGLLKPLLILERPWQYIFINFHKLPPDCNRYDIVIILIDCFSKHLFLIPYYKNINAKEAAQLYIYRFYRSYRSYVLNYVIWLTPYYLIPLVPIILLPAH